MDGAHTDQSSISDDQALSRRSLVAGAVGLVAVATGAFDDVPAFAEMAFPDGTLHVPARDIPVPEQ